MLHKEYCGSHLVQRCSQLLKHNFKTLKSPEIMNSTEVSQSAGGGQRAREASVGKPSLPKLYSGIFSLDGFDNGLDGGRCLGCGNQVVGEWRRRWAVCV